MGLIDRLQKKKPVLVTHVTQQVVLDYLTTLNVHEYSKLLKVANIYRAADKEAEKVLGKPVGQNGMSEKDIAEIFLETPHKQPKPKAKKK